MEINKNIFQKYGMTDEEVEMTVKSYSNERLMANDFLLIEGKISNKIAFIKSGIFRSFVYDNEGNEITTQFFLSGNLIISFESFNNQVPSKENIIAIIDSDISTITFERQKELYKLVPAWQNICKDLADFKSREMISRSLQFQTLSATERYKLFCKQNPEIIQKVALKHIASYLGIDIATLSRIRKKK